MPSPLSVTPRKAPFDRRHQIRRRGQRDVHSLVGFVRRVVLARPPIVASVSLTGHPDPRLAGRSLGPHKPIDPWRPQRDLRFTAIGDRHRVSFADIPIFVQIDPHDTAAMFERTASAVDFDHRDLHPIVEVNFEFRQRRHDFDRHGVDAFDALRVRFHLRPRGCSGGHRRPPSMRAVPRPNPASAS